MMGIVRTFNTEFDDLRKIICLRKFEVSVEKIQLVKSYKNWQSMAYTVSHASIPMTSFICYHSKLDVILMSKWLHRDSRHHSAKVLSTTVVIQ